MLVVPGHEVMMQTPTRSMIGSPVKAKASLALPRCSNSTKMLPPLHGLVQPHDPSGVVGGADIIAAGGTAELVRQSVAAMWRGRAATPVNTVIVVEDVGATMVVVAVSEVAGLPFGSAVVVAWYSVVAVGSVAAARTWNGSSMRYL
jgi:hypothetical protein